MPSTTSNYGLYKPDPGQVGWASMMNANLDSIDSLLASGGGGGSGGSSGTPVNTVPCSPSAIFDHGMGVVQYMLMNQSVTSPAFVNKQPGLMILVLKQDATGNREFTFPSSTFLGATNITVANGLTAANTVCAQTFAYIPSLGLYIAAGNLIYGEQ